MKIHIVSNPLNINSGFSIVARNLGIELMRLVDKNGNRIYDVSCTGLQQAHNPETYFGIESYPVLGTGLDEISQLIMNIKDIEPDIIWNLFQSDSGDFGSHAMVFDSVNRLNELSGGRKDGEGKGEGKIKKIKSFWYTPVESMGLSGIAKRDLLNFIGAGGNVVSQCKWGQNEMKKEGIEAEMIYHGVDSGIFKQMDEKEIRKIYNIANGAISNDCRILKWIIDSDNIKENKTGRWNEDTIFADKLFDIHKGKFVFLVVAANIGVRKRLERAMKAYAIFLRGKNKDGGSRQLIDRTLLHIHTQPFNPEGIKVLKIAEKLGIEKNIIFSYGRWKKGWTDVEMSILYNSSGCHLSGSSGEGFGIGTLESMACGIPTIGPRNTSFIELVEEEVKCQSITAGLDTVTRTIGPRGLLVGGEYQYIIDGSERFLVNEEELANAMMYMYSYFKDLRGYDNYRMNCLKFSKRYTWDKICLEWDKLFRE